MERPIIPTSRTNEPAMSAVEYHDEGRAIIARLEAREAARQGSVTRARSVIARKIGAMPGTLETLARGRLKRLDAYIRRRAEQLLIRELELEITALTHELETLRATGADPRASALAEVEAALATARKLMERG